MLSFLTLTALCLPVAAQDAAQLTDSFDSSPNSITAETLLNHPAIALGDFETAREDWLTALEQEPESHLAKPVLYLIRYVNDSCATPLDIERVKRLAARTTDGAVLELLHDMHLQLASQSLWRDAPLELPNDIHAGWLSNWRLAGPFGALHTPSPLSQPMQAGPAESMPNGRGEMIAWQFVERTRNKRSAPLNRYYNAEGGTMMASDFVKWDGFSPLILEIRSSSAFELWWNGKRKLNLTRQGYDQANDTIRVTLTPEQGAWNTLLFRWEADDHFAPAARFFHLDGTPAQVQEAASDHFPIQYTWAFEPAPFSSAQNIPAPGKTVTTWNDLLSMCLDFFENRVDRALSWKAPQDNDSLKSAYLFWRLKSIHSARHFSASEKRRAKMATLAELSQTQTTWADAEVLRISLLLQEDKASEALAVAKDAILACPDSIALAHFHAAALGGLDSQHILGREAALQNAERWPHHESAWEQLLRWSGSNPARQSFFRNRVLAASAFNRDASLERITEITVQGGEPLERLREQLAQLGEIAPLSYARDLQNHLWAKLGESDLQTERLRNEVKTRPQDQTTKALLAWKLMRLGEFKEAKQLLHDVLNQTPGDHGSRRALEFLNDPHDEAEAFFSEFGPDVEAALAAAPEASEQSTTSTALVLDHGMLFYLPDGAATYRNHSITAALDAQGTRALHERPAASNVHTVRVRDASGRFYEPNLVEDNWVMPSLDPGDLVEWVYDQYHPSTQGAAPTAVQWTFASFDAPYLMSRYVVYIPDGLPGELRLHRFDGEHEVIPWANGKVHIYTRQSERFQDEPLRPLDNEILPQLIQGEDTPLEWRVALYRNWLDRRSSLPADIADLLREDVLSKIDVALDPHQKARAIYAAVREHILEWGGDGDVIDAWLERNGAPLPVLAALFHLADIPFSWALVNPTLAALKPNTPHFERGAGFSLPGIYLPATSNKGQAVWLFPNDRGMPFGAIPNHLADTQGLILDTQGSWVEATLPHDQLDDAWSFDLNLTFELAEDGSASTKGVFRMTGAEGSSTRERLSQAEPNQLDQIARQLTGQFVKGLNLESATFPDLKVAGAPFQVHFSGIIPNFVRENGDNFGCRLQIPDLHLSASLGSPERKWPLAFRQQTRMRTKVRLAPAESWSYQYGPVSHQIQEQAFLYDFQVNDNDGALEVTRTFTSRGLWLEPEQVSGFLERVTAAEKEEKRAVRMIPPPPEAATEAAAETKPEPLPGTTKEAAAHPQQTDNP